jgi:hypothetical protein
MAPTSIKGADTMGIYTTRNIEKGEHILNAPDGPSITLLSDSFRGKTAKFPESNWIHLWGEYAWGRGKGVPDHVSYEAYSIMEFQITTGALPNHHCILDAINYDFPLPNYDDSHVQNGQSPATGAYSYNKGRDFFVDRDVYSGEELFLNYGLCTLKRKADWMIDTPMPSHYKSAIKIMNATWLNVTQGIPENNSTLEYAADVDPLVSKLLPKSVQDLKLLMSRNLEPHELSRELARRKEINQRTPEWIRSHGKCLETMVPGLSRIPHAGMGGFAQSFVAKGEVVVPAPLVHIMDEDVLSIYDENGEKIGDQLVLNYCYGHRDSSLLLCPNTNAVLINHCGRKSKDCRPNAQMRWSEGWDATSDAWRQETLGSLSKKSFRGLTMDIVAIADILPGDEVLMDYGDEWAMAWESHLKSWIPHKYSISAKEANDAKVPPDFMISGDLRRIAKDSRLFAGCQFWPTKFDTSKIWEKTNPKWTNLNDTEILRLYSEDGSNYVGSYKTHRGMNYWPCSIIRSEDAAHSKYTVRIFQIPFEEEEELWDINNLPRFLTNYSRESIHFFVRKLKGDYYLPGVFRHKIGIPDDVFPEHWKNRKQKESKRRSHDWFS